MISLYLQQIEEPQAKKLLRKKKKVPGGAKCGKKFMSQNFAI